MSKPLIKSFSDLLQSFFCQRLQIQQRVSSHTLASYRDTFRLGLEFIRQKTGRTASQQQLTDWDAPNIIAFFGSPRKSARMPATHAQPAVGGCSGFHELRWQSGTHGTGLERSGSGHSLEAVYSSLAWLSRQTRTGRHLGSTAEQHRERPGQRRWDGRKQLPSDQVEQAIGPGERSFPRAG